MPIFQTKNGQFNVADHRLDDFIADYPDAYTTISEGGQQKHMTATAYRESLKPQRPQQDNAEQPKENPFQKQLMESTHSYPNEWSKDFMENLGKEEPSTPLLPEVKPTAWSYIKQAEEQRKVADEAYKAVTDYGFSHDDAADYNSEEYNAISSAHAKQGRKLQRFEKEHADFLNSMTEDEIKAHRQQIAEDPTIPTPAKKVYESQIADNLFARRYRDMSGEEKDVISAYEDMAKKVEESNPKDPALDLYKENIEFLTALRDGDRNKLEDVFVSSDKKEAQALRESIYKKIQSNAPLTMAEQAFALTDEMRATMDERFEVGDMTIRQFWNGLKQEGKALWHGVKALGGETYNLFATDSQDEQRLLRYSQGDPALLKDEDTKKEWEAYLEEHGGDIIKAQNDLKKTIAADESWGDRVIEDVQDQMAQRRETEGMGWLGGLTPQVAPLLLSAATKNPKIATMLSRSNIAFLTASTIGSSIEDARQSGATNGEAWAKGLFDGVIELLSEKLPTERLLKGTAKSSVVGKAVNKTVNLEKKAAAEAVNLVAEAEKKLGRKLFSAANAKDLGGAMLDETLGEAVAGFGQTMTEIIYANPGEYPTLLEAFEAGIEGAEAGLVMGGTVGSFSRYQRHRKERQRRMEQGAMGIAEANVKGERQVVEVVNYDESRGMATVRTEDGDYKDISASDVLTAPIKVNSIDFYNGKRVQEASNAYEEGMSAQDTESQVAVAERYEEAREAVASVLEPEEVAKLDGDDFMNEAHNLSTDGKENVVRNYVNARMAREGMLKAVDQQVETASAEADAQIDAVTNSNGLVQSATTKAGEQVNIVGGEVAVNEDGTINEASSSASVVIMRGGQKEMVTPAELAQVTPAVSASEQKAQMRATMREDILEGINQQVATRKAVRQVTDAAADGRSATLRGDDGGLVDVTLAPASEGMVVVRGAKDIFGADAMEVPATEVASRVQSIAQPATEEEITPEPTANFQEGQNLKFTDGTWAQIEEVDGDGNYVVSTDKPINGRYKTSMTGDELAKRIGLQPQKKSKNNTPARSRVRVGQDVALADGSVGKVAMDTGDGLVVDVNGGAVEVGYGDVQPAQTATANKNVEQPKQEQKPQTKSQQTNQQAPTQQEVEDVDYTQMSPQSVAKALTEAVGEDALTLAKEEAMEAQQRYEQLKAQKPQTSGKTMKDKIDVVNQHKQALQRAKAEAEHWGRVVAELEDPTQTEQPAPDTQETTQQQPSPTDKQMDEFEAVAQEVAKKLGVKVKTMRSIDEVTNSAARREMLNGSVIEGWHISGDTVYLYLPAFDNAERVKKVMYHEAVAHYGIKILFPTKEALNEFYDQVWSMMSPQEQRRFYNHPSAAKITDITERQRAAADEFIAVHSESMDVTKEKSIWRQIVDVVKALIARYHDEDMTIGEVDYMLRRAYENLAEGREQGETSSKVEESRQESAQKFSVKKNGVTPFGDVYTQFKGKPLEAANQLIAQKNGDAIGVFHRDGLGDIDLVWGDQGGGLEHIIHKHVGEGRAFATVEEAIVTIDNIIKNGTENFANGDKVVLNIGDKIVTIRTNVRDKGKKIADKNWVLTAYDESVAEGANSAINTSIEGKAALTTSDNESKVTDKSSAEQKNAGENVVVPVNITEAANQDTEAIKFSVATEDALGERIRDYAKSSQGKKAGWTPEKVEGIIEETRALIGAIDATMRGNEFYDAFADREPTIRTDWRDGELKPIVTWTRANIEYKYDMSADLLCVNNDGIESVLSHPRMVDIMGRITKVREKDASGKTYDLSFAADDYTMLYDILKDMGFVVPCKGCFDAAGRFKMLPSVAQKFAQDVNDVIDERNKNPKKFDKAVKAEAKGEASVEGLPVKYGDKMAAIRAGVAGDNATEHIQWTDLMSAEGQTKLLATHGGIFRAWQRTGAGRPKDKLLAEPYYGDIMAQTGTIIGAYGEKTPSFRDMSVNTGTGLRRNSHSELRPTLFVDEIQFMRDAFLKGLTVFKYTKDLDDVRMFGEMGTKFNMSFFPEHVKGTKASGLDAEGNYIAAEESVGAREFAYTGEDGKRHYDGMKGFEEAKRLVNKDVSLSSVIFSIPHLIKALTDVPTVSDKSGIWGSLIPFHSSGATTAGLAAQGLGMARANGVGHGFEEAMTDYGKGVTNFEAVQNDRFGEGWVILQGKKEGTAVEPGHKLEFVNGTHYYNEALGVHLFASGYALDSEVPADQRHLLNDAKTRKQFMHPLSIDYNERVRKINTPTAYQDAADYYLDIFPKIGLVPRFQFNVAEDVFLQMCKDANVDPNHPKLGWKGEGHAWSPTDAESYYSLFCDYGMTDPATGEWAPHKPIGKVNKNGERVFELPKDAVEIAKTALDRYTEVRQSEDPKVDEAINRFEDKLKEQGRLMFSAKERANMSPAEMLERMSEGQGDDIRFSFIGEKGAEALDKAEEATTRLDNLNIAREMESSGKDARTIKIATGWERGADNKWRYETEDVKLKKDFWKKKDVTLGDVADLGELGKAYPDLKDIKVVLDTNESERRGTYSHKNNTITLYIMDANNTRKVAGAISRNIPFTKFIAEYMTSSAKEAVDKTLVHEIQHAIQSREGFAKGGNKRMRIGESEERLGYEGYRKLAGEVEARNVSERMGKTMDERRASLRTETQDVADKDQIFIYDALESAMGSRVDKRMAEVAQHFADAELSERQRAIVDVFSGVRNNLPITIERADGSTRRVVMRQGREDRGGTKHSLLRHYGTSSGNYTADELLLIEDVLSAEPTRGQRRSVTVNVYQREIDGVRYTVVTEKKDNREEFTDFYTNRSGDTRSLNTQLSARAGHTTASSEREVTPNSVTEQNNGQENDGDTLFSYKPVGGNSGYVGYSMSKRAAQAREEGRFPKTDFKKEYGVTEKVLDALVKAGIVDNAEWHHTSMYGNKTPFYGWVDDAYADVYAENKKAVKQILEGKNADGTPFAELPTENPYTEMRTPLPEGWYPFLNNLDENLTEAEREAVLIERFGDAYAKLKEASENNRLYHEYEANKGRMEREYYAKVGEKLKEFFEERVATASQLTGTDDAGIPYKTYNQEVEGDRKQVVQDYTKELDEEVGGVRFSVADSAPMLNDVAQRGLRDMYGKDYDTFVLDVYANLPEVEREKIANAASKIGWDFPRATEQYLARLADDKTFAEMDADNWSRVRDMFNDMTGTTLNNSDLRYALWRNTENATEKRDDNPLALASDIAMRDRLNRSTEEPGMAMFSVAPSPSVSREKAQVRAVYEHRVRSGAFQAREALQDSMLALKDAMEMITGEKFIDVEDFENAYFGENRLSSTNKAEMDLFDKMVIRPMIEEATRIAPTDEAFEQLVDYMMAKHGLERNALMRERAVQAIKDRVQAQEEAGEEVDYEAADREIDRSLKSDYAGLTTLTGKKNVKDAELEAESMVRVFEENHEVKALWDKVNATNKAILSKQLECGLIDQETYDKIAGMYNYYIPLRGFDEKTAEEVYAYMGQQGSGFAQPIKKAKGRGSKADNPFVYMQMMADSAIMQGNRNVLVKQRFLNFVLNHPNDLVSVNSLWLRKGIDGWVAVFPDNIKDDDTPQQVEAKMKAWEAEMEVKAENYPKLYKKGGQKENIPFRVVHKSDLQQHQIIVMRAGKPVVLTVNGNPRLALAINGLTNPDNKVNGPISAVFATGEYINRKLSAAYTSLNPNFVLSNFMRDMAYTSASVWAKEPAKYAAMFDVFVARFNPIYMGKLYHMHKHGELDMSDPVHKRFAEFIEHGGETGYVALRDVEKHRKDLKKVIKESRGVSAKQGWDYLWAKLDDVNKAVENTARFAAYYTSREQGRSIGRSIYDAKDVSVNFNKKGAGARFMGATGQTYTGNAAAFTAGLGKALYAFWNPAIQGLTNYGRQFKKKPWIASTQAASLFALGALMAVLSDDDDEEGKHQSYYDLPESVRRSNITINIGDGNFITWALPIEFRSIYGLGEIVGSVLSGKAHMTDEEIQKAVLQQVSGMLPLDIAAEGGNAFVPTWAKPIWEVYNNEAYGGVPIYKETGYNGHRPGWAKAYKNTSPWLVEGAKYLNDTIGGGDAHTSAGKYDWNPAVVEHILKGYLGGLYQAPKQLIDMGQVFAGEREYNPSDMLMLNRVLKKGDDRTKNRALDRRYFNAVDRMKVLRARRAGYLRDTETGYENFSDKIAEMVENKDWVRVEIFNEFQRPINELSAIINSSRDEVLIENLENARNDLKRSFLKTLEGVDELGNEESGK